MYGDGVLVILTCYSRPENMSRVVSAWSSQTARSKVIIVDNRRYTGQEHYPFHHGVDDVWRWTWNSGCPCWLAPAAMLSHKYKYIVRADDDLLPGTRAIEHLLKTASDLNDQFAAIGESGRIFHRESNGVIRYRYGDVQRTLNAPRKVDVVCRASMVLAKYIPTILEWRNRLATNVVNSGHWGEDLVNVHDDLLTSTAIQKSGQLPTYITPWSADAQTMLVHTELSGANNELAIHKRPGHLRERQAFVDMAISNGWRSLV